MPQNSCIEMVNLEHCLRKVFTVLLHFEIRPKSESGVRVCLPEY
jgi:hypothetical protein